MLKQRAERFQDLDDQTRVAFLNERIDDLLQISLIKKVVIAIKTDPQAGTEQDDVAWIKDAVWNTLHELRALRTNMSVAHTNIKFKEWDKLIAQSMASPDLIDQSGLNEIAAGATMSWGSRLIYGHKAVCAQINDPQNLANSTPCQTTTLPTTQVVTQVNTSVLPATQEKLPEPTARSTPGATCSYCKKKNHTEQQCYIKERDEKAKKRVEEDKRRARSKSPRRSPKRREYGRRRSRSRS